MDNNNKMTILPKEPVEGKAFAKIIPATETKKCKCCGKEKPLSEFNKRGTGYRNVCKECQYSEDGASEKFKAFSSRELWEELKRRGYKGPIEKHVIEKLD